MAGSKKTMNYQTEGLVTIRDFIRYAVSRFNDSGLFYGHGTFDPLEEAVFLVMESLNMPLGDLEPWWDARLTLPERKKVAGIIEDRITTRKPAAYLVNKTYLQDIPFYVDERVIVPRSYIAELMAEGLSGVEGFPLIENSENINSILDLCTGSGCLAILAAHFFPHAQIDAVELSPDAAEVAEKNIADHELEHRVTLYKGDLFEPLTDKKYDLIITNPPYVAPASMKDMPEEYNHEPDMALSGGGSDGMEIVAKILEVAPAYLAPNGGIICEIGTGQNALIARYPQIPFLWLDTETSSGEVFFLTREEILTAKKQRA